MRVRILAAAVQDLLDGHQFYDAVELGIGRHFLDSLFTDIDSLEVTAGVHEVHFDRYHRLLSKRFPFAVYYRIEGDAAVVFAVLDCRRHPAWIRAVLTRP